MPSFESANIYHASDLEEVRTNLGLAKDWRYVASSSIGRRTIDGLEMAMEGKVHMEYKGG